MQYTARTFNVPEVPGISKKQIDVHLGLYQGYVDHVNKIYELLERLGSEAEKNAFAITQVRRQLGFEFDGMRLHEIYFNDLEGGMHTVPGDSAFYEAIRSQFGSFDKWLDGFKKVAARGSGWIILNYDRHAKRFHQNWVDFHHQGQLATLPAVIAVDFWEHAYMVDYVPADKGQYLDAYLNNLNWENVAKRFDEIK
jgi:Fe-Mn family superoxide dismutase